MTEGERFDIMPGSTYQTGTAVEDLKINASGTNDIHIVTAPWVDLCTEKWYLSPTAIACVEVSGLLKRKRNTGDVTNDIILDYSNTYNMMAMVGVGDDTDDAFKMAAQTVDFKTFFNSGAASLYSSAAIGAIVYALSF